jgi:hypothetical protein
MFTERVVYECRSPDVKVENPGNYLVSGVIAEKWKIAALGVCYSCAALA